MAAGNSVIAETTSPIITRIAVDHIPAGSTPANSIVSMHVRNQIAAIHVLDVVVESAISTAVPSNTLVTVTLVVDIARMKGGVTTRSK